MPIVATRVLEERRIACEAQRAVEQAIAAPEVPAPEPPASAEQAVGSAKPAKVKSGKKPRKADRPKKQPTGDYENGYCRAPIKNRFDGSVAGPGRPKGSVGQDTIARRHLDKRRRITVDGKSITVTHRELIYMQLVNTAIAGKDRRATSHVLADALRLFPERHTTETEGPADLTATGRAILDMFADEIRQEQQNKGTSP